MPAPDDTPGPGQPLSGGMMNTVVRHGNRVVRTAPPAAPAIHAHLGALAARGFDGAPEPVRLHEDGREELTFVPGDVGLPPFSDWTRTESTLSSVAELLRRYHEAAVAIPVESAAPWPSELADPEGGPLLCHNDPCIENVVFRDGRAAALIDFDFAAPGRAVWDVACLAYYWVPMLDPDSLAGTERAGCDVPRRLRVVADGYGLDGPDRAVLPEVVEQVTAVARAFVASRVAVGDTVFTRALEEGGGWERWDRRQAWLAEQRPALARALAV